ncbi:MAG: MerR family transcriptional regulator [Victivallales bacterium]|nr:MerR family transcriptional regulator [Victivallales bacterium]
MNRDSGKHKISDIVRLTGMPRTTINDWVQRYAQYLSFEMQGKRKLYSDRAIEIIQEINQLRESGLNSFEIDEALLKNHPLKPEIADDDERSTRHPEPEEKIAAAAPGEDFAVIARRQTDEIARLISDQLSNLTHRLDELEQENRQLSRNSGKWLRLTALIVFVVFAAGGVLLWQYNRQVEDNVKLHVQHSNAINLIDEKDKNLEAKTSHIETLSKTLSMTRKQHEEGLQKLRQNFEEEKTQLKTKADAEAEARLQAVRLEIEAIREKAAQERLALLEQLTDLKTGNTEKSEIIRQLQQQTVQMSSAIEKLTQSVEVGKTLSTVVAPVPTPVATPTEPAPAALTSETIVNTIKPDEPSAELNTERK